MPQETEFVYPQLQCDRLDKLTEEMIESLTWTYWNSDNPYIDPKDAPITGVHLRFDPEHEGFHVEIVTKRPDKAPVLEPAGYITKSRDGHFATGPMAG